MGLILGARCARCGFERAALRLGATMEQMSGEHRTFAHLYRCPSCRDLACVERVLGEETAAPACPGCGGAIGEREHEYRISRLKGLALEGHACPRCGEGTLSFREEGKFL